VRRRDVRRRLDVIKIFHREPSVGWILLHVLSKTLETKVFHPFPSFLVVGANRIRGRKKMIRRRRRKRTISADVKSQRA